MGWPGGRWTHGHFLRIGSDFGARLMVDFSLVDLVGREDLRLRGFLELSLVQRDWNDNPLSVTSRPQESGARGKVDLANSELAVHWLHSALIALAAGKC